jgi:hypothetical protein
MSDTAPGEWLVVAKADDFSLDDFLAAYTPQPGSFINVYTLGEVTFMHGEGPPPEGEHFRLYGKGIPDAYLWQAATLAEIIADLQGVASIWAGS